MTQVVQIFSDNNDKAQYNKVEGETVKNYWRNLRSQRLHPATCIGVISAIYTSENQS